MHTGLLPETVNNKGLGMNAWMMDGSQAGRMNGCMAGYLPKRMRMVRMVLLVGGWAHQSKLQDSTWGISVLYVRAQDYTRALDLPGTKHNSNTKTSYCW